MMDDSRRLEDLLAEYTRYFYEVLLPTYDEAKILFKEWKRANYWAGSTDVARVAVPSPVQRISARIKRPESVVDKIRRKPPDYPQGLCKESFEGMTDVVGLRAMVYFLGNLPLVDSELRKMKVLEISSEHPPTAYLSEDTANRCGLEHLRRFDKDSGYCSLHYIIRLRESIVPEHRRPWIELQVRTLAEDSWAEIEHLLGYKPGKRTFFAVRRQFQILSMQLAAIDEHFNFLHEELYRLQQEVEFAPTDPLNAENLPSILSEVRIGCTQREIDGLLKLLTSRGFQAIQDFQTVATAVRIQKIRTVYMSEKHRLPTNFELVANLAALRQPASDDEERDRIKTQIKYLDAWDSLKRRRRPTSGL